MIYIQEGATMSDDLYQRLRKGVAKHSAYFQATASGLEIEFLRRLFTEEEAEIYLNLTGNLETAHQIAERAAQDPEVVAASLKRMAKKGLVFPKRTGDSYSYAAPPFAHGSRRPSSRTTPHRPVRHDRLPAPE
jgi:electron transport complex protein RnfB